MERPARRRPCAQRLRRALTEVPGECNRYQREFLIRWYGAGIKPARPRNSFGGKYRDALYASCRFAARTYNIRATRTSCRDSSIVKGCDTLSYRLCNCCLTES